MALKAIFIAFILALPAIASSQCEPEILQSCLELVQNNPSPDELCQNFKLAYSCLSDVKENCAGEPMSEAAGDYLSSIKETMKTNDCQDGEITLTSEWTTTPMTTFNTTFTSTLPTTEQREPELLIVPSEKNLTVDPLKNSTLLPRTGVNQTIDINGTLPISELDNSTIVNSTSGELYNNTADPDTDLGNMTTPSPNGNSTEAATDNPSPGSSPAPRSDPATGNPSPSSSPAPGKEQVTDDPNAVSSTTAMSTSSVGPGGCDWAEIGECNSVLEGLETVDSNLKCITLGKVFDCLNSVLPNCDGDETMSQMVTSSLDQLEQQITEMCSATDPPPSPGTNSPWLIGGGGDFMGGGGDGMPDYGMPDGAIDSPMNMEEEEIAGVYPISYNSDGGGYDAFGNSFDWDNYARGGYSDGEYFASPGGDYYYPMGDTILFSDTPNYDYGEHTYDYNYNNDDLPGPMPGDVMYDMVDAFMLPPTSAPICDWASVKACYSILHPDGLHQLATQMCSPMEEAMACFNKFFPLCGEGETITEMVTDRVERLKSDLTLQCGADFSDDDDDDDQEERTEHGHDSCTWPKLKACSDPLASLAGKTDSTVCEPYQEGKACLEQLVHTCTSGLRAHFVHDTLHKVKVALTAFCETSSLESPSDCDWVAIGKCTASLPGNHGVNDPDLVCGPWKDGKDCLEKVAPYCAPGGEKWMVHNTMSDLEKGLGLMCSHDAPPNEERCSWFALKSCEGHMAGMEGRTDAGMCGPLGTAIDCLKTMIPDCTGGRAAYMHEVLNKAALANTAFCEEDEQTSPEDCTWEAVGECTVPLKEIAGQTSPDVICKPTAEGKTCLERLAPICPPGDIKWVVVETLMKLEVALVHLCSHYEKEESKSCDWDDLRQCTGPMESLAGESDLKKICTMWEGVQQCLEDMDKVCHEENIKNVLWSTLGTIKSNFEGSCSASGCSMQGVQSCLLPWQEFQGQENLHLVKDKLCPAMTSVKECLRELQPTCNGSNGAIVTQALESTETNMNMFNCQNEDNDDKCTMMKLQQCAEPFQTILQQPGVEKSEMCRVWSERKHCLDDLMGFCPSGQILTSAESMWKALSQSMRHCDDSEGNQQGGRQGGSTGVSTRPSPLFVFVVMAIVLAMFRH